LSVNFKYNTQQYLILNTQKKTEYGHMLQCINYCSISKYE
jgi:hypothetical protein